MHRQLLRAEGDGVVRLRENTIKIMCLNIFSTEAKAELLRTYRGISFHTEGVVQLKLRLRKLKVDAVKFLQLKRSQK